MKRSILAYGHSVLKKDCVSINKDYPQLQTLIADLWETMENANGCGLAASQIGIPIRLFVVDSLSSYRNLDYEDRTVYFDVTDEGIRETFINAKIIKRSDEMWEDEEGCLSIPGISRKVKRSWSITIEYYNAHFEKQRREFSGLTARMIQHEYDHTLGILYLDHLQPLTKRMLESKLQKIRKGQITNCYAMTFI